MAISEFSVVFNESLTAPGFDITVRGLQTVSADHMEVFRRDPSGRYPDRRVRGMANVLITDNDLFVTDYEPPLNIELEYYLALIEGGTRSLTGPVFPTPQPFIPTLTDAYGDGVAYLKVIDRPELSMPLMIEDLTSWSYGGRVQGRYDVLGRRNPVVITDVLGGREGSFTGHCVLDRGQSSKQLLETFESGATFLLQNNNATVSAFEDMYFKVEQLEFERRTKMVRHGDRDNPTTPQVVVTFTVNYVEVDRPDPTGLNIAVLTWGILNDTHDDWEHVLERYNAWEAVLVNPHGPS